jgi:hypothetical protein
LPVLDASAPSRVVVVSSSAHGAAELDFDDLAAARLWSVSERRIGEALGRADAARAEAG